MASGDNKVLQQLIRKLGLANYESVAPKATELQRLLEIRSSGGNIGDYAKATICIDLASSLLGFPFDNDTAMKLSGLKKSAYANARRTLEKLLDINKTLGIGEICVQAGVSQVQKEAATLLEAYKQYAGGQGELDFTHPQYATMAVFQACKRQKVKPPKTKLVSFSHLRPAQWSLLEKNWEKFLASGPIAGSAAQQGKAAQTRSGEAKETQSVEAVADSSGTGAVRKHASPEKIEPYQNWKKRMLEKAYRDLEFQRGSG
uniref:Origin recognition complex subunit 6 n=1 Tax=Anopheles epiroticus TaxID=199890 RepID=A0A182P353_9DIPT